MTRPHYRRICFKECLVHAAASLLASRIANAKPGAAFDGKRYIGGEDAAATNRYDDYYSFHWPCDAASAFLHYGGKIAMSATCRRARHHNDEKRNEAAGTKAIAASFYLPASSVVRASGDCDRRESAGGRRRLVTNTTKRTPLLYRRAIRVSLLPGDDARPPAFYVVPTVIRRLVAMPFWKCAVAIEVFFASDDISMLRRRSTA